jgi:hypothetical protein
MNGWDDDRRRGDWDDRRRGESWERMGGIDRVLDRALQLTRELYRLIQSAEAGVDDVVRDLKRAEGVHREAERFERRGEALERKEEAIEREALRDLTGGRRRGDFDDRGRGRDMGRPGNAPGARY